MATKTVTTCDECGVEKRECNHWFMLEKVVSMSGGFFLRLFEWNQRITDVKHLCGQACVHAVVDRFLSTGKIEKPAERGELVRA